MKILKQLLIIFPLLVSGKIYAQQENCNCKAVFDNMLQKLESNYIGLSQMRLSGKAGEYDARKSEFGKQVNIVRSENCTEFLQKFLSYFKDGHLFAFEQPKYTEAELGNFRHKVEENKISSSTLLKTVNLEKNWIEKTGLDGIIGKWTDGQSEYAIIKDEGFYKAYILNSKTESKKTGELKAQLKTTAKGFEGVFYSDDYSPGYVEGNLYKEGTLLVFTGGRYWGKVEPSSKREINMIDKSAVNLPVVQKLDEQNTLLSIPSFLIDANQFNKVLFDNIEILTNTTNLIIDIRGNIGGNAIYFDLISAYATNPLPSSQGLVLASEDTKKYFESLVKYGAAIYKPLVSRIEASMGEIVDGPAYPGQKFNPFPSKIQKVAILTDEGCASAAESFVIHSKAASTKVTTFGSPTAGIIDYTSVNTVKLESGTQHILFGYPTSTFHKDIPLNGYNVTGILPDVKINDKTKDKILFIIKWFKKQKDK